MLLFTNNRSQRIDFMLLTDTPTYNRARALMLSHMLPRMLYCSSGDGGWEACDDSWGVKVGDLVLVSGQEDPVFYMSWLEGFEDRGSLSLYKLRSIDDNSVSGWCRCVSATHYDRYIVSQHPEWKWSDDQFCVHDSWVKICDRFLVENPDGFSQPEDAVIFSDDGSVKLLLVEMGGPTKKDPYRIVCNYPSWRGLLPATMAYDLFSGGAG